MQFAAIHTCAIFKYAINVATSPYVLASNATNWQRFAIGHPTSDSCIRWIPSFGLQHLAPMPSQTVEMASEGFFGRIVADLAN